MSEGAAKYREQGFPYSSTYLIIGKNLFTTAWADLIMKKDQNLYIQWTKSLLFCFIKANCLVRNRFSVLAEEDEKKQSDLII